MRNNKKILVKIFLAAGAIATPIIYAYEYGPDPGYTGAPGDNATGCIASGCHVGTPNSGPGSVTITASGGTTYSPGGPPQTITVTIADSTEKKYGFQLSARVDSSPKTTPAGILASGSDGLTQVSCDRQFAVFAHHRLCGKNGQHAAVDRAHAGWLRQERNVPRRAIRTRSAGPRPQRNVGTVTLYAAGNAVTGALWSPGRTSTSAKLTLFAECVESRRPDNYSGRNQPPLQFGDDHSTRRVGAVVWHKPRTLRHHALEGRFRYDPRRHHRDREQQARSYLLRESHPAQFPGPGRHRYGQRASCGHDSKRYGDLHSYAGDCCAVIPPAERPARYGHYLARAGRRGTICSDQRDRHLDTPQSRRKPGTQSSCTPSALVPRTRLCPPAKHWDRECSARLRITSS